MATINVRVEDDVRDRLKAIADDEGVTVSEYVRDLILEAIRPVSEERHGDQPAPDSLSLIDRQVLSMLHRILGRVLPDEGADGDGDLDYQLMRAEILESGYSGEYWLEVAGFRTELSKRDSRRVLDILQMFRIITYSTSRLAESGEPLSEDTARRLEFRGFDHNDPLESHMASYVEFLMRDGRRWTELRPQLEDHDDGNSHMPVLDTYLRMLIEYRRIMDARDRGFGRDDYLLSGEDLGRIAEAWVHPSRRG